MATLNIELDNLSNGQEVLLPIEVSGTVSAPAAGPTLSALARQIDDNALVTLPLPNNNLPHAFSFEVAATECPDINTWYMLTIYAWDNQGDCTIASLTFKRIAEPLSDNTTLPLP